MCPSLNAREQVQITDKIVVLRILIFRFLYDKREERIILRWIFRKWEGVVGTGWSWLRIGTGGGHL
jgi:hypothetical protein